MNCHNGSIKKMKHVTSSDVRLIWLNICFNSFKPLEVTILLTLSPMTKVTDYWVLSSIWLQIDCGRKVAYINIDRQMKLYSKIVRDNFSKLVADNSLNRMLIQIYFRWRLVYKKLLEGGSGDCFMNQFHAKTICPLTKKYQEA